MNPAKRFTKEEWNKGFEFIDKARKASNNVSNKEAEKIIAEAVKEVRNIKNAKSHS